MKRVGELFRFITPVLIALTGTLGGLVLQDIRSSLRDLSVGQKEISEKLSDHAERLAVVETRLAIVKR